MKKICTFFGLLISMCLLLNVGFSSLSVKGAAAGNTEQTSDSNFTNLIVFARFADENEFVNDIYQGVSVREIIDNSITLPIIPWAITTGMRPQTNCA